MYRQTVGMHVEAKYNITVGDLSGGEMGVGGGVPS